MLFLQQSMLRLAYGQNNMHTYQPNPNACGSTAIWTEAGLHFRSSIVNKIGDKIPLHEHSYDHVALITKGWFYVKEVDKDGNITEYQLASSEFVPTRKDFVFAPVGNKVTVLAYHQHEFTLLEGIPAEVLCVSVNNT